MKECPKRTSKLVAGPGGGVLAQLEGVKAEVAGGTARLEHGGARHVESVGEVLDDSNNSEDLPEAARGNLEEGLGGDRVGLHAISATKSEMLAHFQEGKKGLEPAMDIWRRKGHNLRWTRREGGRTPERGSQGWQAWKHVRA
jgi:hypothetical protein